VNAHVEAPSGAPVSPPATRAGVDTLLSKAADGAEDSREEAERLIDSLHRGGLADEWSSRADLEFRRWRESLPEDLDVRLGPPRCYRDGCYVEVTYDRADSHASARQALAKVWLEGHWPGISIRTGAYPCRIDSAKSCSYWILGTTTN
jgi:hypothetical protein